MRTKQEIESDIGRECVIAGDLQYRVAAYQSQLAQTNDRLGKFHQEMHDLINAPLAEIEPEQAEVSDVQV